MRTEPTWRIPVGVLGLFVALMLYGNVIARTVPGVIESWPGVLQGAVYIVLGIIWLLPLKRFLIWMETGKWG